MASLQIPIQDRRCSVPTNDSDDAGHDFHNALYLEIDWLLDPCNDLIDSVEDPCSGHSVGAASCNIGEHSGEQSYTLVEDGIGYHDHCSNALAVPIDS